MGETRGHGDTGTRGKGDAETRGCGGGLGGGGYDGYKLGAGGMRDGQHSTFS